jgi:tetratricopeptide (TPR) repeat protein
LDQAEVRYWQLAVERGPQDAESSRGLAQAFSRLGRFDEAVAEWQRLLSIAVEDSGATAALAVLQPLASQVGGEIAMLRQAWASQAGNSEAGLKLADALIAAEQFAEAEKILADVQSAAGADLKVLEEREKLQMAKSNQRLAIARRWKEFDAHPKAQTLATQLEGEHQRLEIEIWNNRTERMPNDWSVRLELARRLKQVGNFSGAIQRLEEAQKLKVNHPGAFIELGECFQHLRQFEKALHLYEQAVSKAETLSSNDEVLKLARYRTGVLATALGQRDFARQNLQALVTADPGFKDARQRLDKLGVS